MKKLLVLVGIIVLAWLGYSIAYPRQKTVNRIESGSIPAAAPAPGAVAPAPEAIAAQASVTYENNAFSPSTLTVKVGTVVTFVNKGASNIRIPSNPHPLHSSFSEFDSETLAPGEGYSFTFTKPMTLNYHNHYNPGVTGRVIAQ